MNRSYDDNWCPIISHDNCIHMIDVSTEPGMKIVARLRISTRLQFPEVTNKVLLQEMLSTAKHVDPHDPAITF